MMLSDWMLCFEEAATGVACAPDAGSEQRYRGLDGDMVQTYNFGSMSSQPGVAPGQDGDLFDSSGNLKGLCLAALAGSEVTDPVRTRLAPQPMRHQSVASCAISKGTAALSQAVLHLSASSTYAMPLIVLQRDSHCHCRAVSLSQAVDADMCSDAVILHAV